MTSSEDDNTDNTSEKNAQDADRIHQASSAPTSNINLEDLYFTDLVESWARLSAHERKVGFRKLNRMDAEELFLMLKADDQIELLSEISPQEKRSWIRLLAPDDAADLIQAIDEPHRAQVLNLLDGVSRKEVTALLSYAEDKAGGLMNSRFVRLRPDLQVDEALLYLRLQAKTQVETVYSAYVINASHHLVGVVSFREILCAPPEKRIRDIMEIDFVVARDDLDQEALGRLFSQYDLMVIPVVDIEGKMKGIVTVDDIVTVVEEEATEDIQKLGGMEALDAPYLQINIFEMIKKRAGWLLIFFVGEMLTASTMSMYAEDMHKALVLALFIPLIMSAGGNSGSQASTLIIRAMALGEIRLKDWWKVFLREVVSGAALGCILATIGFFRILLWPGRATVYGEHYALIATAVALSLVCIVLWGTMCGSMLPFALRRCGLDPASASAPFVATLVDVTGLVIYFSVAHVILGGALL